MVDLHCSVLGLHYRNKALDGPSDPLTVFMYMTGRAVAIMIACDPHFSMSMQLISDGGNVNN